MKSREILLFAGLMLAGCTRTTTLTGCIVVNTSDGDRPAAGAIVMVAPASETFESDWQALLRSFHDEARRSRVAYDEARGRVDAARAGEREVLAAQHRALRVPALARYSVHEDESGVRVWTNQQPPPSVLTAVRATSEAVAALREAERRLTRVSDVHLGRAIEAIKTHRVATADADARGCFALSGVPIQRVRVFANHGDRYWFRDVDVAHAPAQLDLVPGASGWPFADGNRRS